MWNIFRTESREQHELDESKHCQTAFGFYCEVRDELEITFALRPWTHETIAMGPTYIIEGSYKFLHLEIERKTVRRRWTEIPMPQSFIEKLRLWGRMMGTTMAYAFLTNMDINIISLKMRNRTQQMSQESIKIYRQTSQGSQ